jgi:hypothetical protein
MDDDEYLREVRIKLIGEGKLLSPAVVTPSATFAALSPSEPTGSPPGHIAIASQLPRSDSPPSPSPAGRPTKSGKSLATIAILRKQLAQQQECEADEEEGEEGGQEREGDVQVKAGKEEEENEEVEVEVGEEEYDVEEEDDVEEEAQDEDRHVEIQDEQQHSRVGNPSN